MGYAYDMYYKFIFYQFIIFLYTHFTKYFFYYKLHLWLKKKNQKNIYKMILIHEINYFYILNNII